MNRKTYQSLRLILLKIEIMKTPNRLLNTMYGKGIIKLMLARQLSAYKLAKLTGISKSTISRITRDIHATPRIKTLAKIADALKVRIKDLLT